MAPGHRTAASTPPIFVVGCPRSGTTLVREILDSHSAISCGPETQFLSSFTRIEDEHWERLSRFGISLADWRRSVADFFAKLHIDYADRRGKVRWADKSPNYALILDYIDALFPECQVVHVIRDGRDVVASYRARWGSVEARKAVRAWRRHIESARRSSLAQFPDRYTEVRYEELVAQPEPTMRRIFAFLGEPWEEGVLNFGEVHRPGTGADSPEARQRQAAAAGKSAVYGSSVGAGRNWQEAELRLRLWLANRDLMRELGYR